MQLSPAESRGRVKGGGEGGGLRPVSFSLAESRGSAADYFMNTNFLNSIRQRPAKKSPVQPE